MIEPLRFEKEIAPPFSIDRPVFCSTCLFTRATRKNPNIAIKYCAECPKRFVCASCDEKNHDLIGGKPHVRRMLVIGPAVRKRVLTRGDKFNFPLPLDTVEIEMSSRIYNEGKLLVENHKQHFDFIAGLSGASVHIQLLGCGGLIAADTSGTSDPFITTIFNGKQLHMTRTRRRTLNPRWNNESVIVPLSDTLPPPRNAMRSQKNLLKLEVYDYDSFNENDFLGHVEITKAKLEKLAVRAKMHPIRLPLSVREFHGLIGIQMGIRHQTFYIKIVRGECLDKMDAFGLSDPYVKVHFGDRYIGKTPVHSNTLDPEWKVFNVFHIKLSDIQQKEAEYLKRKRARGNQDVRNADMIDDDVMFRLEAYDFNYFRSHGHLGTVRVPWDYLRKMCTFMPKKIITSDQSFRQRLISMSGKALSFRGDLNSSTNTPTSSRKGQGKDKEKETFSGKLMSTKWFGSSVSDLANQRDSDKEEIESEVKENVEESEEEEEVIDVVHDPEVLKDEDDIFKSIYSKIDSNSTRRKIKFKPVGNNESQESPNGRPLTAENLKDQPTKPRLIASAEALKALEAGGSGETLPSPPERRNGLLGQQFYSNGSSPTPGGDSNGAVEDEAKESSKAMGISTNSETIENAQNLKAQTPTLEMIPEGQHGMLAIANGDISSDKGGPDGATLKNEPAPMLGGASSKRKDPSKKTDGKESGSGSGSGSGSDSDSDSNSDADSEVVDDVSMWGTMKTSMSVFGNTLDKYKDSVKRIFYPTEEDKEAALIRKKKDSIKWSPIRHFAVQKLTSKNVVDEKNRDRGYLLVRLVVANRGNVIAGLDEGVRQMTLGETALLKVRFDYGYGSYSMGPDIPPRSNMIFKVRLLAINEMNWRGMPWRQLKRFNRMVWRRIAACKHQTAICMARIRRSKTFKYMMKTLFNIDIITDEDEVLVEAESSSEESYESSESEITLDTTATPIVTEEDLRMRKHLNSQTIAGARGMWGFSKHTKQLPPARRPRKPEEIEAAKIRAKQKKKAKKAELLLQALHEEEARSLLEDISEEEEAEEEAGVDEQFEEMTDAELLYAEVPENEDEEVEKTEAKLAALDRSKSGPNLQGLSAANAKFINQLRLEDADAEALDMGAVLEEDAADEDEGDALLNALHQGEIAEGPSATAVDSAPANQAQFDHEMMVANRKRNLGRTDHHGGESETPHVAQSHRHHSISSTADHTETTHPHGEGHVRHRSMSGHSQDEDHHQPHDDSHHHSKSIAHSTRHAGDQTAALMESMRHRPKPPPDTVTQS